MCWVPLHPPPHYRHTSAQTARQAAPSGRTAHAHSPEYTVGTVTSIPAMQSGARARCVPTPQPDTAALCAFAASQSTHAAQRPASVSELANTHSVNHHSHMATAGRACVCVPRACHPLTSQHAGAGGCPVQSDPGTAGRELTCAGNTEHTAYCAGGV